MVVGDFSGQETPSPKERAFHASACLVDEHNCHLSLLVTGGQSASHKTLGDSWLFDFIDNRGWTQVHNIHVHAVMITRAYVTCK